MRTIKFRLVLALALATASSPGFVEAGPVAADVSIQARELAPGEPARIVVDAGEEIAEARATFLGRAVFLAPAGGEPSGSRWSGWGIVDLGDPRGIAVIEVRGSTRSGHELVGTRAVTIRHRAFPEERLDVAPRFVEPPEDQRANIADQKRRLARIWAGRTRPATGGEPFVKPVPGGPTSTFGTRRVFNGKPRDPHPGLDLRAAPGTTVLSSGAGRVVIAEPLYYAGKTVIVDHGGGLTTIYAHLSKIDVSVGDNVTRGQLLGSSGATGRVTGPHLHWGAKVGDRPFDPRALLDARLFTF